MKEKSVLKPEPKKKVKTWWKCLRCASSCKRNTGLKENYTCPMCGELSSYYVKEMHN